MSVKIITGEVRFSYAHVWEPKAMNEGADAKYSVSILIPKTDTATIAKIEAAIKSELEELKAKLGGKLSGKIHRPLRDGDEERPDDEAYEGHYFINANSKNQPQIVDETVSPILERNEFYSGCYGRASFNLYGFNSSGNKGVGCGLNNVQKLREGDRLGGGSTAADDFGSDDDLL